MAQSKMERRLAAVLAVDAVGYSRLMEANEESTHAAFKAHLEEVVQPAVASHRGRIVKLTGDGALAEFPSVVHATASAVEIQRGMAVRNADVPEDRRIDFRIGINVGDVISDQGDIYGDGVNIAVRLEELAGRGEIYLSQAAHDYVKGKVDFAFRAVGNRHLKNLAQTVSVYRVDLGRRAPTVGAPHRTATRSRRLRTIGATTAAVSIVALGATIWFKPALPLFHSTGCELPATPSIAVLPFKNSSNDPEQEYLVDGTTNDIITDLAKFSNLFVIAANSTFRYKNTAVKPQDVARDLCVRYVLEGNFQKFDKHIRVNAQLIDARTGYHLWADRYDRKYTDVLDIQNDITREIVNVIGPISNAQGRLLDAELDRISQTPTRNLRAYDHFLKGMVHYTQFSKYDNLTAREEFETALDHDPKYAKAVAKIAWTYLSEYWNGWGEDFAGALERAEKIALKAVELRPSEPDAHEILGAVRLFLRQHDLAIGSLHRAVELNPNGADLLMHLGWAMTYTDQLDQAFHWMEEAISRNPYYPGYYLWDLAWGHFVAHQYDQSISALERRANKSNFTYLLLAVNYKKVGREKDAMESMRIFRELEPAYSVEVAAAAEPFKRASDLNHFLDALREVGLPETSTENRS